MNRPNTTTGVGGESAVNLQKFMANVNFPATKQDVLDVIERDQAPQEVIDAISSLSESNFSDLRDVVASYELSLRNHDKEANNPPQ